MTKARDALTEYLHEVDNPNLDTAFPYSSSVNDVSSMSSLTQSQHSPSDKSPPYHKFSTSPNSKDIFINDYSTGNDQQTNYHYYPLTPPISTHISSSQTAISSNQRSRSPSMTPNNFIRVHFPNKHTTAVGQHDLFLIDHNHVLLACIT